MESRTKIDGLSMMFKLPFRILIFSLSIVAFFMFASGSMVKKELPVMEKGQFQLNAYGVANQDICGSATFIEKVTQDRKGEESSQVWLKFDFSTTEDHNSIEIVLSNSQVKDIKVGKAYKFDNRSQTYADFDGIYGFADIAAIDELPFFAERGTLTVKEMDGNVIQGELNAEFKNASKGKIIFKGSFNANE